MYLAELSCLDLFVLLLLLLHLLELLLFEYLHSRRFQSFVHQHLQNWFNLCVEIKKLAFIDLSVLVESLLAREEKPCGWLVDKEISLDISFVLGEFVGQSLDVLIGLEFLVDSAWDWKRCTLVMTLVAETAGLVIGLLLDWVLDIFEDFLHFLLVCVLVRGGDGVGISANDLAMVHKILSLGREVGLFLGFSELALGLDDSGLGVEVVGFALECLHSINN